MHDQLIHKNSTGGRRGREPGQGAAERTLHGMEINAKQSGRQIYSLGRATLTEFKVDVEYRVEVKWDGEKVWYYLTDAYGNLKVSDWKTVLAAITRHKLAQHRAEELREGA